ncbi:hypothetical protein EWM62_11470 [Mucilaginibacter terrigena]|uniref:Colicin D immunity protein domain-containing protein n=1 Tax=Mucilaginibacter terrigena TaxID=2492395 RepID=A0A4Q5LM15_9SPHI|nr:colicin immunity domain-containing protein [Mucilaginibacter terrigena]RYU90153.1 hypothetical protein EWM62_11470 [Mucilaginibacter terrigena]
MKLLDRIHLQKYIYLMDQFLNDTIGAELFDTIFIQLRREDNYWMSGSFDYLTQKILDTYFLDIDEYTPVHLFEKNDSYNIDEEELKRRTREVYKKLTDG